MQPKARMSERTALISRLEQLGFYAFTPPSRRAAEMRRAARGGDLYGDVTKRFFFCNSEDLAEGGVLRLLRKIKAPLATRGVRLERVEEEFEPDHYVVRVNGITYPIYGPEVRDGAELWRISRVRALDLINDLLARAGSEERVYHLGGAEDGAAVFLTPAMVTLIHSHESLSESWLPDRS